MRVIADPINNTVNLITAICYNNGLPKNIIWECFIFPHIWGGDAISRRSPDTVNLINSSSVVRIVFRIPFFLLLSFFFFPPPRLKARFAAEKTDTPSIPKAAGSKQRRDTNRGQRSTIWCRVAFFHTFSTSCFPHIKTLKRRRRRREKPILSQVSRREKKRKKNFHKWRSNIWNESLISHYLRGCGDNWGKFLRESAPTTTFPVTIRDDRRDKETSKFWGMFPSLLGCFLTAVSKRLKTLWYHKGQRRPSRDSDLTPQQPNWFWLL